MVKTPDKTKARTERLGFRLAPDKAEKVRKLADLEEVPYADLLREKADELVARYDRIMRNAEPTANGPRK